MVAAATRRRMVRRLQAPHGLWLLWTISALAAVVGWGVSTKIEVEQQQQQQQQQQLGAARKAIGQVWREIELLRKSKRGDDIPKQVQSINSEQELHFYFARIEKGSQREDEWKRIRAKLGALLQDGNRGRRAESAHRLNGVDAITKAHMQLVQVRTMRVRPWCARNRGAIAIAAA